MRTKESDLVRHLFAEVLGKRVIREKFDNFFTIVQGVPKDLGEKRPAGMQPLSQAPVFALVREDRSAKTKTVKFLGPIRESAAVETAKGIVETERDKDLVVIIGKSIGRLDGRMVFKDVAGFKFKDQADDLIDKMEPKFGQKFTPKERACLSRNIREKIREGMPPAQAFAASVSICAPKKVRPKKPEPTEKQSFTDKPWNGDKARFSDEQLRRAVPRAVLTWARSRAKTEGREVVRADLKLPFKEPSGVINLGGVRAALASVGGARDGVDLPTNVKAAARKELESALERGKAALSKSV